MSEETEVVGENAVGDDSVGQSYPHSFARFRPNNVGTGSMCTMNVTAPTNDQNGALYVTIIPQKAGTKIGEKGMFDRAANLTVKLNATEVGALLQVCAGPVGTKAGNTDRDGKFWAGLTHKPQGSDAPGKTVYFERMDNGLKLSISVKGGKTLGFIYPNNGDNVVVEDYLRRALSVMEPV